MKALITGGAGFIGSHLAERLIGRADEVVVIDDLSTGRIENLAGLSGNDRFSFVFDSVRNEQTMSQLVQQCDIVYHLAAAVGVQLIADEPVHTIETNIHGSEVVLNMANKFRRPVFLASTSEVYGKSEKVPFCEDDDTVLGSTRFSRWSYACSKAIDEFLGLAYHDEYGLPVVIGRFFNTVGPRQVGHYGMVVPRFVQWALAGDDLLICGDGQQSRAFCHVSDVVDAVIQLVNCEDGYGKVFNIGSDEEITIEGLAKMVIELTDSDSRIRKVSYEEMYGRPLDDTRRRVPSLERLSGVIDYRREYDLRATLKSIITKMRLEN